MTDSKLKKSVSKTDSFENIVIAPETPSRVVAEAVLKKLRRALILLYSATYSDDGCKYDDSDYYPFKNYRKPLDFVNNQIDNITQFLISNAKYYLGYCKIVNFDSYVKLVKDARDNAKRKTQLGFEDCPDTPEYVLADAMTCTFFYNLDKIFIFRVRNIIYHIDEITYEFFGD